MLCQPCSEPQNSCVLPRAKERAPITPPPERSLTAFPSCPPDPGSYAQLAPNPMQTSETPSFHTHHAKDCLVSPPCTHRDM